MPQQIAIKKVNLLNSRIVGSKIMSPVIGAESHKCVMAYCPDMEAIRIQFSEEKATVFVPMSNVLSFEVLDKEEAVEYRVTAKVEEMKPAPIEPNKLPTPTVEPAGVKPEGLTINTLGGLDGYIPWPKKEEPVTPKHPDVKPSPKNTKHGKKR